MKQPAILIAGDATAECEALSGALREEFGLTAVVADGRPLVESVLAERPQVVLADVGVFDGQRIDAVVQIRKQWPGGRILFLTTHTTPACAREALAAGAAGFVLKHASVAELYAAIRTILNGGTYLPAEMMTPGSAAPATRSWVGPNPMLGLSRRQQEILPLLVEGLAPKEIAIRLGISHRTVEFHKYQTMMRLGCRTFPEMIRLAVEHGVRPG